MRTESATREAARQRCDCDGGIRDAKEARFGKEGRKDRGKEGGREEDRDDGVLPVKFRLHSIL